MKRICANCGSWKMHREQPKVGFCNILDSLIDNIDFPGGSCPDNGVAKDEFGLVVTGYNFGCIHWHGKGMKKL